MALRLGVEHQPTLGETQGELDARHVAGVDGGSELPLVNRTDEEKAAIALEVVLTHREEAPLDDLKALQEGFDVAVSVGLVDVL